MRFDYKGKKLNGEIIQGVLEADNRRLVINKLQQMQVFPISINEIGGGKGLSAEISLNTIRRVSGRDVATFSRQMSDLLRAGLPLARALDVIVAQTTNPKLQEIVKKVSGEVQGGTSFSDALSKHNRVFPSLYSSMVKAGELGGMLDQVMERLSNFLENEQETRSKIISALTYPAFMVMVCIFVIIVLFTVVIPNFQTMFEDAEITLPISTRILMSASVMVSQWWWIFIIGFIALIFLIRQYIKTEAGGIQFDTIKLHLPLFGELIRKREIAKFARTLGTLLGNGVAILNALAITEQVISNRILKQDIEGFADNIKEGAKLSTRMEESDLFPPVAVNMVAVGEETGNLENTLQRVADAFEGETDRVIKTITTIIEPVMIVFMAVVVGFIVFAMIMPIFQLSQSMS